MGISEYPWEIVGIDHVTDLPKSGTYGHTSVFEMVCHKEITTHELADLFSWNCYRLHDVPKVIVSNKDPKFQAELYGKFKHHIKYEYCSTPSH